LPRFQFLPNFPFCPQLLFFSKVSVIFLYRKNRIDEEIEINYLLNDFEHDVTLISIKETRSTSPICMPEGESFLPTSQWRAPKISLRVESYDAVFRHFLFTKFGPVKYFFQTPSFISF